MHVLNQIKPREGVYNAANDISKLMNIMSLKTQFYPIKHQSNDRSQNRPSKRLIPGENF